ncbi:unnamed protein product [Cochlearia groenlandica]
MIGIDAKETCAMLWNILGSSINTTIMFMRNHLVLSLASMFLLVLYIFLPSLLFFLIYSSPVLACALIYAREKLGLRFSSSWTNSFGGGEGENNGTLRTKYCGPLNPLRFSEIGSPPTTVDWLDDWSNGGESCTYDTDIHREINYPR